ncbi:MAG: molybdopterin cofactor-binding domain-containing protein [Gemmobacter sp.]
MALNYQGNGLGTLPPDDGAATLALAPDGMIEIACGLDEMGQGLIPALQAAVAAHLGCARGDVRAVYGDTGAAPDAGSTSASRGGYIVWQAAALTAPGLARRMVAAAAAHLGCDPAGLAVVPGGVGDARQNDPRPRMTFAALARAMLPGGLPRESAAFAFPKADYTAGNARYIFAFGATLARVAVSRVTGQTRVLDLHLHSACGPVIDLASYLGQMEGGMIQGLGFTLTEDAVMTDARYVTRNLDTYLMPTLRDAPGRMVATALESLDPGDPHGPRGAGELGIGAVTPAIANAIAAAIGHWPARTPIPPETLLPADLHDRPPFLLSGSILGGAGGRQPPADRAARQDAGAAR